MKIRSVDAYWVHIPIPPEKQHTSDFGRTTSFDATLVRIDTECGLTGWGEAKSQVGSMAANQALTAMINEEFAPLLVGEDPRDITRLWETLYNGSRAHYALREGRVFPVLGRRGITISALSGIDCALWDILGKSLGVPVWRLLGGRRSPTMPAYASGGWAGPDKIGEQLLGLCRGRRVPRGQDAGRHHRRRPAPLGAPGGCGPRRARPRLRVDVRCARHLLGGRGQALLPPRRGLQPRLVRGAGDRRRQGRVRPGARRDGHPDRRRRERIHAARFPRSGDAGGGRHFPARSGDLRRHHRGDADFGARQRPSI